MSGPSVLIVDDDLDTRAKLRDILEKDDYRVAEAASISEALLERDWSEYLAILLDRRLPDQPVALVLPRLRQLAPDSAVIVVTAHDDIAGATGRSATGPSIIFSSRSILSSSASGCDGSPSTAGSRKSVEKRTGSPVRCSTRWERMSPCSTIMEQSSPSTGHGEISPRQTRRKA